jgi:hypothetical protein
MSSSAQKLDAAFRDIFAGRVTMRQVEMLDGRRCSTKLLRPDVHPRPERP